MKDIENVKVKTLLSLYQKNIESEEEIDGIDSIEIRELFEKMHPANASKLIKDISNGIDNGFDPQGTYHPEFQSVVNYIVKDPSERYEEPQELMNRYSIIADKENYKKYKELEEKYGSLSEVLDQVEKD